MKLNHPARLLAAIALLAIGVGSPLAAQARGDLIQQARNEFDASRRLDLLERATDPTGGALDSLWAVGVFDLAQNLIGSGEVAAGALWLRWAARHGPQWGIDRGYYSPSTVAAYERAVPSVRTEETADTSWVTTSWRWPADFDATAQGSVRATTSNPSVPVEVTVEGRGTVPPGGALELEPATYLLVAEAPGFEAVRVTREVLPGATTVLEFTLPPLLPATSEARVEPSLVTIRYLQAGRQVCTSGLMARPNGLVLTAAAAIGAQEGLEIRTPGGAFRSASVAATDTGLGLAVLRVDAAGQPTLAEASDMAGGSFVWSRFNTGCEGASTSRTRLSDWPSRPTGPVRFSPTLPAAATGSPLFDRGGGLVGVVTGPDQVAPIRLAEELLARATQDVVTEAQAGAGGGLPWVWIGAGAAAVGVAAAVLGGGGGGETPPPNGTGSVTVTFPGGGL
jgi:hypothetical protein